VDISAFWHGKPQAGFERILWPRSCSSRSFCTVSILLL